MVSLEYKDIFKEQLRAILRAGYGFENMRIMFPMISSVEEFIQAKETVMDCMSSLHDRKLMFQDKLKIGMMVEIPSVVPIIDELAAICDFFCIGTNDFTQFMLAVDRTNEKVSSYYQPQHPAILRSLNTIVKAGINAGIDVSICGEMAHEKQFIPFLIGIGVSTLSVDSRFLPEIQEYINQLKMNQCQEFAANILTKSRAYEIEKLLAEFIPA